MRKCLLDRRWVGMFALWMTLMTLAPSNSFAMPSDSMTMLQTVSIREAQVEKIMRALASPFAKNHLHMAGVDESQLKSALLKLDDAQLADVAAKADAVKAGGDGLGFIIALLVIVLLIVLILNVSNKKIEVKDAQ